MCARTRGILLATLLLGSVGLAAASDRPPRNLHLVGDHWTAWNPPTPPADAQVHVVVKGDTLWDLAKHYYGDPSLYMKIFEANRDVLKDPNLIKVGQRLRIP